MSVMQSTEFVSVSGPRPAAWVVLALLSATTADAAPHKLPVPNKAASDKFVQDCIHERTSPTGGISRTAAAHLCRAIVRNQAKIAKAAELAVNAIQACRMTVVAACVETSNSNSECDDAALQHAFEICTGGGPAWSAPATLTLIPIGRRVSASQRKAYFECLDEVDVDPDISAAERCAGELE